MIKFIQDYTTKALPPEHFDKDQEVERSPESEAYFVRQGIAGYLVDGALLDQEYKPIIVTTVTVTEVVSGDRRFADGGRGGEVLGLDAPQRASTGPGNAVVFGGADTVSTSDGQLHRVEVEQLSPDVAASAEPVKVTTTEAPASKPGKAK